MLQRSCLCTDRAAQLPLYRSCARLAWLARARSAADSRCTAVQIDSDSSISVDGKSIRIVSNRDPLKLPWGEMGVDLVIEGTGVFVDEAGAGKHLQAGASKARACHPLRAHACSLLRAAARASCVLHMSRTRSIAEALSALASTSAHCVRVPLTAAARPCRSSSPRRARATSRRS
jgi:Glyceraldehyde 3-phosphate dehydrogenase, NAD binding domain